MAPMATLGWEVDGLLRAAEMKRRQRPLPREEILPRYMRKESADTLDQHGADDLRRYI